MSGTRLLSEDEVADLLNIRPATLTVWRSRSKGPSWVVNPDSGRFIGYTQDDVEHWVLSGRTTPDRAV